MPRTILFCLALLTLTGCGAVNYDDTKPGTFTGSLFVMWVGEGDRLGDGTFVFVPNPDNPLTFTRADGSGVVQDITPGMMYTDGGSIPRVGQLFNGFSPWGYAPAYMVHDWIFVARHCLNDGMASADEQKMAPITFQESAEVIAEAIKGLIETDKVQANDVAPRVISGAVAGPLTYNRWVVKGACNADRVSDKHRQEVEALLSPRALPSFNGVEAAVIVPGTARIVTEISF